MRSTRREPLLMHNTMRITEGHLDAFAQAIDRAVDFVEEHGPHAATHYDDEQLTAIVAQIAVINAFNKLSVITQQPPSTTSPGSSDSEEPAGSATKFYLGGVHHDPDRDRLLLGHRLRPRAR